MIHTCYSTIIPTSISLVAKIWWYSTWYNGGKIMYDHNRMDAKQGEVANYHSIPKKKTYIHQDILFGGFIPHFSSSPALSEQLGSL